MNRRGPMLVAAEAGLAAVTMAAVLGMARLFDGGGWIGPLLAHAAAAHLLLAVVRRRGLSLLWSAFAAVGGAVLVSSWATYWSTTAVGLPTGATWTAMGDDLDRAWSLYQDVVAPAPAETGFVVASGLAVWCVAYVADWAAFRLWVPFEASLPAGTLFLFTALLGSEQGRGWATALYAAAVLGFLLLHRLARQEGSSHWVADRRAAGQRSLLAVGGSLAATAVVVGSVLGPSVPGADSPGVIDPQSFRAGNDSRVTISPLVDIKSRLVDQAQVEVFQVRASQRAYWRLTSLERFDGRIWSSSGSFGKAGATLPSAVEADVPTASIDQVYEIEALAAIWLPTAYQPQALDIDGATVRYDAESATLIVDTDVPTSDSLSYRVQSAVPRLEADDLTGLTGVAPDDIRSTFLDLPAGFPPRVRDLAEELTGGATGAAAKARALQDHLRSFRYSLDAPAGHSDTALESFLFDTQEGYCEQFAGAFAAMARSVGLPARVAVGFTPGEEDAAEPGLYRVRGEYAHAWPEVYIEGAGWVAYEPTPGRGMPGAEGYTGVPEAQAVASDPGSSVQQPPVTTPTTAPGDQIPGEIPQRDPLDGLDTGPTASPDADAGPSVGSYLTEPIRRVGPFVLAVLAAYLIAFPASVALWRARRRRRAVTPRERIELAWVESAQVAGLTGFREHPSHTPAERGGHLAAAVPDAAPAAFALAAHLESAIYAADGSDEGAAEASEAARDELHAAVLAAASRRDRARRWLDPRVGLAGWRQRRRARHRQISQSARGDLEQARELAGSGGRR